MIGKKSLRREREGREGRERVMEGKMRGEHEVGTILRIKGEKGDREGRKRKSGGQKKRKDKEKGKVGSRQSGKN